MCALVNSPYQQLQAVFQRLQQLAAFQLEKSSRQTLLPFTSDGTVRSTRVEDSNERCRQGVAMQRCRVAPGRAHVLRVHSRHAT